MLVFEYISSSALISILELCFAGCEVIDIPNCDMAEILVFSQGSAVIVPSKNSLQNSFKGKNFMNYRFIYRRHYLAPLRQKFAERMYEDICHPD